MYSTLNDFFILQAIPVAWALMSGKPTEAYDAVLECLKKQFPNLSPKYAHSDFETGMHKSLRRAWPGITVIACEFHWAQVKQVTLGYYCAIKIKINMDFRLSIQKAGR